MIIFCTRFTNKDKGYSYLSGQNDKTYEEAVKAAEVAIKYWNDGTTYEIIEYIPKPIKG